MNKRFRANPTVSAPGRVDKEKGIIYDVSVVTEGPALGHGVELEREFVENVVRLGNQAPKGTRSRFGHPGMSSEALGTYMGRYSNYRAIERSGKLRAIADFTVDPSTKTAPGGDRGAYVLDLAESDPEAFATSIVFKGWKYKRDSAGNKVVKPKRPDYPKGSAGYNARDSDDDKYIALGSTEYASIEALPFVDFVDQPAANPDGLFSNDTFAGMAGKFLRDNPEINEMLQSNPKLLVALSKMEEFDSFFEGFPQLREFIDKNPEKAEGFIEKYNKNVTPEGGEEGSLKLSEFKTKHPDLYTEVYEEGYNAHRERAEAHLSLGKENDALDIAAEAIAEDAKLGEKYIARYIQAGINKRGLSDRQEDNPDAGEPEDEAPQLSAEAKEREASIARIEAYATGGR